jgi:hypothetical protein
MRQQHPNLPLLLLPAITIAGHLVLLHSRPAAADPG